jgi:hypothetical protein
LRFDETVEGTWVWDETACVDDDTASQFPEPDFAEQGEALMEAPSVETFDGQRTGRSWLCLWMWTPAIRTGSFEA